MTSAFFVAFIVCVWPPSELIPVGTWDGSVKQGKSAEGFIHAFVCSAPTLTRARMLFSLVGFTVKKTCPKRSSWQRKLTDVFAS